MLSGCAQGLDKLSKSFVQVSDLSAVSTGRLLAGNLGGFLYRFVPTAIRHIYSCYTQPNIGVFYLLAAGLYPLSTGPITNTKFI